MNDSLRDLLFGALFGALLGLTLGGFLLLPRADEREIRNAARGLVPEGGTITRLTVVEPPVAGGERERPYTATAEFHSALGREALEAAIEAAARSKGWRRTRGDGQSRRGVLEYQFRDRRILATYELRANGAAITTRRDRSGNGFRGLVGAFVGAWLGGALFYGVGKVDRMDRELRLARWRRAGRAGDGVVGADEPGEAQRRGGWVRRLAGPRDYSLALHTVLSVEECRERLRADFQNPKRHIPPEGVSDRNVYGELKGDGFRVRLREGAGSRHPRYYNGALTPEGGGTRIDGRYGYAPYVQAYLWLMIPLLILITGALLVSGVVGMGRGDPDAWIGIFIAVVAAGIAVLSLTRTDEAQQLADEGGYIAGYLRELLDATETVSPEQPR